MKIRQKTLILAMMISLAGSILLPASCIPAYGADASASLPEDYLAASSPVKMDVIYGYEGAAKGNRYIPVSFVMENQEDEAFEGTIQVQAMESDFDIYEYDYPVTLEPLQSTELSVYLPVGRADLLYAKLVDQSGIELIRKRLKITVSKDVAELFVGVLADQPEELDYLDGIVLNYTTVRTKTIHMTAEDMPKQAIGLDLLDILLITDYNASKLSEDQISAVWEWVKGGGTLLLGTGARVDDVLGPWKDEILEEPYAAPVQRSVDMGVEYATNGPGDSFIDLVCADISLRGGQELIANDQFPVLTSVSKGDGKVGVAAYDFKDIADFCEVQRTYIDKLFNSLLGEERLNELSSFLYNGNSSEYWSVQNVLNTGNVDKLPNLPLYVVVILGYIVLVGPGLYFFLKKQERRRLYRPAVLLLSFGFAALIYLMGVGTRFKDAFFTYATIYDTSDDEITENTYVNIRTPYNKPYTINLDPSYDLQPITRNYYYDMTPVPKFTGDEESKVRISRETDTTQVSVQNVVSFSPQYFSLSKKTANENRVGLTGDITLYADGIYGTVTNHYDFPVEKVGILMYGQMVVIDGLDPGETKQLDGLPAIHYPLSSSYITAERVTGSFQYTAPDINNEDYLLALHRTNILLFYMDRFASTYNLEARIVGFGRDENESRFLSSGNYESYGITLLTSTVDVNMQKNGSVYRSALMKSPTVISGQYYASSNAAYGLDPLILEYSLGNDIQVNSLTFEKVSEELLANERYGTQTQFGGTMYFYNHGTGNYDAMESGKDTFTARDLDPYLSPGNTLTVKYSFDNATENNWYVSLPMPAVLGRNK